jgi:hypothetical protein
MFFPDRIAGYREARRVLKPGGRFVFNVWDRIEDNDFARVVTDAAATRSQAIRRGSSLERRTATTMSSRSRPICGRPAFQPLRFQRFKRKALL